MTTSDKWLLAVMAKANQIIDQSRDALETDDQGYGESQFLRGRIVSAREMLAVIKPRLVQSDKVERFPTTKSVRSRSKE